LEIHKEVEAVEEVEEVEEVEVEEGVEVQEVAVEHVLEIRLASKIAKEDKL
jgi:hypothetical protein